MMATQTTYSRSFLRYKKIEGVDTLAVRYHPGRLFGLFASRILEERRGPLFRHTINRYAARPDGLWWTVVVSIGIGIAGKNKTYRSHHTRRAKEAFAQALRQSGYDRNGKRLKNSGTDREDLRGSLFMSGFPKLLTATPQELIHQSGLVIAALEAGKAYYMATKQNTTLEVGQIKPGDIQQPEGEALEVSLESEVESHVESPLLKSNKSALPNRGTGLAKPFQIRRLPPRK